jgi:hypothetical protein
VIRRPHDSLIRDEIACLMASLPVEERCVVADLMRAAADRPSVPVDHREVFAELAFTLDAAIRGSAPLAALEFLAEAGGSRN